MKIRTTIITLIITLTVISGLFAKSNEVYFKFEISDRSEIDALTKIVSIDNVKARTVFAYANPKEFKAFLTRGIDYEILPHPGTLIDPVMAFSKEQMREWDVYPTYETYVSMMNDFVTNYPGLCEIVDIGDSGNGRDLLFVKISDNVSTDEDEPEFMYTASMHGDETAGYILMLRLIDYLLSNYATDTRVANLVNNVEIWINPLANPDGTYAGGNSSVSGATRGNANLIDLNRNYPDPEDGDHPDGNAWQIETIAFMDFADTHNFVLSANLHGGEEVVNYPWDTWSQLHADDDWFQEISHTYADAAQANSPAGYLDGFDDGITNGYAWYSIDGGRQDYMNYWHGCREVTIELSATKLLPEAELDNHWNYNSESFLLYMEECLYGVRGIVTDEYDAPLSATISISGHDNNNSEVTTDPTIGSYHRMLFTGTYDLTFTATGYDPITIEDVVVTDNAITLVNVQFGTSDVTQSIDLSTGWNLNSFNVHPTDMTPETVFSSIESNLLQVKNLSESYDPDLPSHMNTLDELTDGFGYWINVDADVTLDVTGLPVDILNTTIHLNTGWNLAGYVCQSAQNVEVALAGIMANLEQVKSLTQTYDPDLPPYMNTLDQMEPDLGYWINVSADCDLIYPIPSRGSNNEIVNLRDYPNWEPVIYPNNTAVLYGYVQINGIPADENDVIGAFVGDECRGVGTVSIHQSTAYITFVINVAENSEIVSFKLYDADEDNIITLNNTMELNIGETIGSYPDNLIFFNAFSTEIEEDPVVNSDVIRLSNYPNPFNPSTTISFTLAQTSSFVNLGIYNLRGQKVKDLSPSLCHPEFIEGRGETQYSVVWNGTDDNNQPVSSGIYFYQLKIDNKIVASKNCLLLK